MNPILFVEDDRKMSVDFFTNECAIQQPLMAHLLDVV
jgi:hypothetical protein